MKSVRHGLLLLGFLAAVFVFLVLPRLLVLNNATASDYIAVLDGHDTNFYEGLRLLRNGTAKGMFVCLDLPDVSLRDFELQQDLTFVRKTAGPLANVINICRNESDDPLTEVHDLAVRANAQRVLIVTPAPESRSMYTFATREYPGLAWSVDPTSDVNFDLHWWKSRRSTEIYFDSVTRLVSAVVQTQTSPGSEEYSAK